MGRGGKRVGSGRKKLGKDVRVKIEENIIDEINEFSKGLTQSDKIRNCIKLGLQLLKQERKQTNE